MSDQERQGIRGAIDVPANKSEEILECYKRTTAGNHAQKFLDKEQIAAVIFSMTADLMLFFPQKPHGNWVGNTCPYSAPMKSTFRAHFRAVSVY